MKKGISLIVLVITIIVIIILAGAVILSLVQNSPIGQANEAVRTNDASEIESALAMYLGTVMGSAKDSVKLDVTGWTDLTDTTPINVVTTGGVQLYRNDASPFDIVAAATAPTDYSAVTVTSDKLGLNGYRTYAGYTLQVDQYANVEYRPVTTP